MPQLPFAKGHRAAPERCLPSQICLEVTTTCSPSNAMTNICSHKYATRIITASACSSACWRQRHAILARTQRHNAHAISHGQALSSGPRQLSSTHTRQVGVQTSNKSRHTKAKHQNSDLSISISHLAIICPMLSTTNPCVINISQWECSRGQVRTMKRQSMPSRRCGPKWRTHLQSKTDAKIPNVP